MNRLNLPVDLVDKELAHVSIVSLPFPPLPLHLDSWTFLAGWIPHRHPILFLHWCKEWPRLCYFTFYEPEKSPKQKVLRNFNVGHWGQWEKYWIISSSTIIVIKLLLPQIIKGKPFKIIFSLLMDFYIRISINLFLTLSNFLFNL